MAPPIRRPLARRVQRSFDTAGKNPEHLESRTCGAASPKTTSTSDPRPSAPRARGCWHLKIETFSTADPKTDSTFRPDPSTPRALLFGESSRDRPSEGQKEPPQTQTHANPKSRRSEDHLQLEPELTWTKKANARRPSAARTRCCPSREEVRPKTANRSNPRRPEPEKKSARRRPTAQTRDWILETATPKGTGVSDPGPSKPPPRKAPVSRIQDPPPPPARRLLVGRILEGPV